jgi:antitoxin component of MazEF toxin-antitoxin module
MEDARMSSSSTDLRATYVAPKGHLVVPADVVRGADLAPGDEVVFEPALGGFFVQSRASAEAEDADDLAELQAADTDPDSDGEAVDWAEVKRELDL